MSAPWLNGRSHFSVGESLATPKGLVDAAVAAGLSSLLLTDTMTVSGMPELFTAASKTTVKPMIGARLRVVRELTRDKASAKKDRPYYLRAIVLNDLGWTNLLGLLTLSFEGDHFYAVPRLLLDDVLEAASRGGLAITLGDAYGALQAGTASDVISGCRSRGVPLYADATLAPTALGHRILHDALMLQDEGVPTLLAPPALYLAEEEADSLDLMASIARKMPMDYMSARHEFRAHIIGDASDISGRAASCIAAVISRFPTPPGASYADRITAAWDNSRELEILVTFKWEKMPPSLPVMAPDEFGELAKRSVHGLAGRFAGSVFGHTPPLTERKDYKDRLMRELKVIRDLGFSSYFLLVSDVVNWAKEKGVRVGPGRGSIGGSLIGYAIGITDVDPLRFGLIFERFINPERIDLPDADLDFASLRREEVVTYIRERFGEDYVAGVVNYNTLLAAGALNDVCRMLGVDNSGPAFSKIVPKEHGKSWTLEEALDEVPEIAAFAANNPEVIRHARHLEGCIRTFGKHAAGVIVAGVPLRERAVVERRGDSQVVNWDKRLAEDFGLVKLDVLGLSTLDMMDITLQEITKRHGKAVDILSIPLDDEATLAAFGRGETKGIFQFESFGMVRLLRSLAKPRPLIFDDLAAATALYRPGPMDSGLMDDFVKIRQGTRAESYDDPSVKDALRETQGVIVYQEQVMQVARDMAGFTMPEADHLRKIMGKKQMDKVEEWRDKFVDGAVTANGVKRELAMEIFDKIAKFAQYGFNKSHAVAYSLISYQTMWLKQHYPVEFWSGVLSMVKEDRRQVCLMDMGRMGIKLSPPDVNESSEHFSPLNDAIILAPFSAVKGISERSTKLIIEARDAKGKFISMADFEKKVAGRACNVAQREKLSLVGAFARVEPGQLPPDDPSRLRDQMDLLPGLIVDTVMIDREMDLSVTALANLSQLVGEWKACERCELKGLCHPKPYITGPARAMLVLDGPSYKEEAADEMGHGSHADALSEALLGAGMLMEETYITSLVKSPKPGKGKPWSATTLGQCSAWLDDEIRILKPPVVVVLGSEVFRHFFKGLKGGMQEHLGRVIYDKDRDLNFLIGFNPNAIYFSPEKQEVLNEIAQKLAQLLPFR